MAKLTLNVESEVIQAAKNYASAHHVSLSKLVTQFLRDLPQRSCTRGLRIIPSTLS